MPEEKKLTKTRLCSYIHEEINTKTCFFTPN